MKNKLILSSIAILLFCNACQKEIIESREYPRVKTLEVIDISSSGAVLKGEILTLGSNPIIEQGFVWDTLSYLSFNDARKVVIESHDKVRSFSYKVTSDLVKDKKYYTKAFARTKDYLVFGEKVTFKSKGSLPPEINEFKPQSGIWGDTISVLGHHFSSKNNDVFFGDVKANVIFNSDTLVKAIVPSVKNEHNVKIIVKTQDYSVSSADNFIYRLPIIENFIPKSGTFGEEVQLIGSYLLGYENSVKVYVDGNNAEVVDASSTVIKFLIPSGIKNKDVPICILVNANFVCHDQYFTIQNFD